MSDPLLPVLLAVPVVVLACQASRRSSARSWPGSCSAPRCSAGSPTVQQHLLPPSVLPVTSALGNLGLLTFDPRMTPPTTHEDPERAPAQEATR